MSQLNDTELDQILGEIQELQHTIQATPVAAAAPVAAATAEETPASIPEAAQPTVEMSMDAMPEIVNEAAMDTHVAQVPSMEELEAMVAQSTAPEEVSDAMMEVMADAAPPVEAPALEEISAVLGDVPAAAETPDEPFLPERTETPVEEVMMEEVLSGVHPEDGELMQSVPAATANVIQAPFPKNRADRDGGRAPANGNQNMNLQLTYEGQVINVSFNGGFIYIVMADGTEFKIPTKATQAGYGNTSQSQAG